MTGSTSRRRQTAVVVLAAALMFAGRFLPPFPGLSASGMQVLGIFAGVLLLWTTVSISWPSLLLLAALAFVPELKFSSVLAASYGSSTFVFLLFTFALTYALGNTSFLRRAAVRFVTSPLAQKGVWWFLTLYCASILLAGCFVSPTVLFFLYLPIAEQIFSLLKREKGDKLAAVVMMLTVIMCGISSGMTPIGHVFPILAMTAYETTFGRSISYAAYMGMAVPTGLLTAAGVLVMFRLCAGPLQGTFSGIDARDLGEMPAKPERDEIRVAVVFGLCVLLWVLPGIFSPLTDWGVMKKLNSLGTAFPPIVGVVLLSVMTDRQGRPLLDLNEAFRKGVSWPALIMCAATAALGSALANPEIGVMDWLSALLTPLTGQVSSGVVVLIFALWAGLQTNFSSNMVTATVVSAAAMALAPGMASVNAAALAMIIGMLSADAFAAPSAMPSVAAACASGWTDTKTMLGYGLGAMLIAVLAAWGVGYPLAGALI